MRAHLRTYPAGFDYSRERDHTKVVYTTNDCAVSDSLGNSINLEIMLNQGARLIVKGSETMGATVTLKC